MKGPRKDLTGQRFGRLTVIGYSHQRGSRAYWRCRCDCGKESVPMQQSLRAGVSRSCGCLAAELKRTKGRNATHGQSESPTWNSWCAMRSRCTDQKLWTYPMYGGRGIRVCERWTSFEAFLADMGERPAGTTLERIDNDRGYEPGNCRWATSSEQARNRRSNRMVLHEGRWLTIAEYAEAVGLPYRTALWRLVTGARSPAPRRDQLPQAAA